jgi:hypothetical protein
MELANALYFPYLEIRNETWLKTAALYYSKLLRIVPAEVTVRDGNAARELVDGCGFIENVEGSDEAEIVAIDFVNEMRQKSPWPQTLPDMFRKRRDFKSIQFPTRLHVNKLTYSTLGALAEMGLAEDYRRLAPRQHWIKVEPRAAAIYMTMLAERIAERRGISTVTDDLLFQQWSRYFCFEPANARSNPVTFRVPELVIRTAVPKAIEKISVAKIIQFRKKHQAERLRFFDAISRLSKDLLLVQDQSALEDLVRQHEATVLDAVEQLKRSLMGVQVDSVAGLIGVSLPPLLAQIVHTPSAAMIAGGISIAAGIKSFGFWRQYTRIRDASPWGYVLSLSKISATTFIENGARGEILV